MEIFSGNEIYRSSPKIKPVDFNIEMFYQHLGYSTGAVPGFVVDFVQTAIQHIPTMIAPQWTISILQESVVVFDKKSMTCGNQQFHTEPIITKRLRTASTVAFFVCSIGKQFEEWSKHETDSGDLLKGYILDLIASEVVEGVADQMELQLDEIISGRGWKRTNRYSPGYCDWSVSEQHKLFSFFPPHPCGVSLTDSALMLPIKSISGVIGLGPNAIRKDYECSLCNLEHCFMRRNPAPQNSAIL